MENKIIKILGFTLGFLFTILIGSLICWELGNLIIFVFKINYTWTFLHGLTADLVWLFLKGIFSK